MKKIITTLILSLGIVGCFSISAAETSRQLTFDITKIGTGEVAKYGQRATLHYIGKLEDGSVFDSSRERGKPFSFTLGAGQVIQGWEQGVLGMQIGEVRILDIPPHLGYGEQGAGASIPPNARLIFEVELLSLENPPQLQNAAVMDFKEAQEKDFLIIDIRRPEEWAETGILEGAKTITAFTEGGALHPDFQRKFFPLIDDEDTPIYLYCRTGNRTGALGDALVNQVGLRNVTHLENGIVGWKKNGFLTVPYQSN
tara:strand:+ start:1281 stop:2045 length:765 start_codon:yes stop_codon:yes gene_type:complete